ncbi:MAG TPA: hypothetical protein VNP04_03915 [Alphaproteobacteria bacterium]|jgi:hypothetical protein|nr:hypothetical protein [Alphaproteobacteria bacterium]
MAVQVRHHQTQETFVGKFAKVEQGQVLLYSGIMQDKKGRWRGCGKRLTFPAELVSLTADDPERELQRA